MAVKINKGSALASLSLTPLIDIVFLLLIFFLVATKFAEEERELEVQLPEASEARPLSSPPKELSVNVIYYDDDEYQDNRILNDADRYYVNGKTLSLEELYPVLNEAYTNNPGRVTAIIRADERCRYKSVIAAKNACLKAKIRDIRETVRPGGP